jgi:1-acyl-sn-glycerol-3-phosphate acyltransferase
VLAAVLGTLSGWSVQGRERVPRHGGLIVASNHISFWDPPMIGSACPRELHYLAKDELFRTPVLGAMIRAYHAIPIRRGVADLAGMSRAIETVRGGAALLLFPEGSRMRDGELHPARPGVGLMAVHADVPIVPCFVTGTDRPGRWWHRGARVRIAFGEARAWRDLAGEGDLAPGRALYQRVGDAVMREIAALKAGVHDSAVRGTATSRSQSS